MDVLVNNAGIYLTTLREQLPDTDLDAMPAVDVRAPDVLVAALVPAGADRGNGVVVNIGVLDGTGPPRGATYTATKAADEQLTRSWAAEYGPRGVRVNAVAPGVTHTPGNEAHGAVLDRMGATTPAGVPVQPEDVAEGVRWPVVERSRMVQGTTLYVDGGIAATRLG